MSVKDKNSEGQHVVPSWVDPIWPQHSDHRHIKEGPSNWVI